MSLHSVMGGDYEVMGAQILFPRTGPYKGPVGSMIPIPPKPPWRQSQVIPGVNAPSTGKQYVPLVPSQNNGLFTAAIFNIEFAARPQRPFRPERLLVSVVRTGASATGRILSNGIFVGATLQSAQRGNIDIELIGTGSFFDTSLRLEAADTAMDIALPCTLSSALAGADTIFVSAMWLGETIT